MSWRTLVVLALAAGNGVPGAAQAPTRISLEEALQLHAEHNLGLRLARAQAATRIGEARAAAITPNPSVGVSHESLHDDAREAGETYFTVGQEVVWPWVIAARSRAAGHARDAVRAQLEADSLRLVFEVRRVFVDAWLLERHEIVIARVAGVFRAADAAAAERYAAGDLSGYERRRLGLELLRYERILDDLRVRASMARRQLTDLVVPEGDATSLAPEGLPDVSAVRPPDPLASVDAHPLVRGARSDLGAAEGRAREARGQRVPAPTLTGGYKTQRDGLSGLFLGAALPLPVFDRRGGQAQAADGLVDAAEARVRLARRAVLADVAAATERFHLAQGQLDRARELEAAAPAGLLEIARTSYAEGELGLFGLLDAARTYHELGAVTDEALAQYWLAAFDLERALGVPFVGATTEGGSE